MANDEAFWSAEVKAEPKTASKRRSPAQPCLQPAAKKGRLVRQRSPPTLTEGASMDSDATMEECVSPSRHGKAKKKAFESDDDEDYVPGQLASSTTVLPEQEMWSVRYVHGRPRIFRVSWADDPSEVCWRVMQPKVNSLCKYSAIFSTAVCLLPRSGC